MAMQDGATSSVNDSGTCEQIDAPLTQRRSPAVLRDLLVKRNAVGRETRAGRLLSNLIEQRPWLNDDTGDRSWATHETQQVAWMMGRQVEALARGN